MPSQLPSTGMAQVWPSASVKEDALRASSVMLFRNGSPVSSMM